MTKIQNTEQNNTPQKGCMFYTCVIDNRGVDLDQLFTSKGIRAAGKTLVLHIAVFGLILRISYGSMVLQVLRGQGCLGYNYL